MGTTSIYRTQISDTSTVSTVLVREGRERWYETTIIVSGVALDGRRTDRKAQAGIEHDGAVDFARGHRDEHTARTAFWTRAFGEVAA